MAEPAEETGEVTALSKNVLYVIDGAGFGGGERVFLQLAAKLKNEYRVFVAACPGGGFQHKIEKENVAFIPVDLSRRVTPKPLTQIVRAIRRFGIDIVHSQGARADFYARVSGKLAGAAHQVCTLAMPVEGFDVGVLKKTVYRLADRATETVVDRFIVVSDALRNMLIDKRGIDHHRVVRIYNGIELNRYAPGKFDPAATQTVSGSADEILIGCFGRLVWQKGFETLIRAIPDVLSKNAAVRFVIVGEGMDRDRLEKLAGEIGVRSRLTFTGFVGDIRPWLSRVDIVAIPSLREGFPMITLEAMAMAKPIVATNISGIDEQLCHERSALLVPPGSVSALSEALSTLARNRDLAQALGKEARCVVEEQFSLEKTIDATKRLYDTLIGQREANRIT